MLIIKPSTLLSYNNIFEEGSPVSALWHFEEDDDNIVYLLDIALKEFLRDGYSSIIEAYLTAVFGKLLNIYKLEKTRVPNDTVLQI